MKIVEIILTEKVNPNECWSEEMSASQILAEIGMTAQPPEDTNRRETVFRRCDSYKETYFLKVRPYRTIRKKFSEFMELKRWNPNQPFGKSDKLFLNAGNFIRVIPNLKHAHITMDLSIVYKLEGGVIWLYGFYTHDDLGTGQPANQRVQSAMATKFSNKTEIDCPVGTTQPNPKFR